MSDDKWLWAMYLVSVLGSILAMLYPRLLGLVRGGPAIAVLYRKPFSSITGYAFGVVAVSAIVSALGFAAFIRGTDLEAPVKDLGLLAYFSAFTFGFGAGSAAEEPLKAP